jgi:hypothetical protein
MVIASKRGRFRATVVGRGCSTGAAFWEDTISG